MPVKSTVQNSTEHNESAPIFQNSFTTASVVSREQQRARHLVSVEVADAGDVSLFTPREHAEPRELSAHRLRNEVAHAAAVLVRNRLEGAAAVEEQSGDRI